MIRTITKTLGAVRRLRKDDLRSYARGYLDEALESYGYSKRATGLAGALPLVGAFSAGVAIGTGLGVLVAPRSGKETRELLGQRVREALDRMTREEAHDGQGSIITDDPEITHGRGPIGHS